ncbi:MAG: PKD domain-containing protein [Filimonas sp.]|nr:PKD domain-containing protein [Filimonas sp.]
MKTQRWKSINPYLWLMLLLLCTSAARSQTITIDNTNFSTDPYGRGSSIALPIRVSGCFATNNTFRLVLSDASGNFSPGTQIGSYTGDYTGFLNGTIPNGIAAGTGYRLRVESTSPAIITAPSIPFTIDATNVPPAIQVTPASASSVLQTNYAYGNCTPNNNAIIMLNQGTAGATASGTLIDMAAGGSVSSHTIGAGSYTFQPGQSYYTYIVKATQNGVNSTRAYFIINNITKVLFGVAGVQEACIPDDFVFQVGVTGTGGIIDNFPGQTYTIDWGDGTSSQYRYCELIASNGVVKHQYQVTSCTMSNATYDATLTVQSNWPNQANCATTSPVKTNAKIYKRPVPIFIYSDTACVNSSVHFENKSEPGQNGFGTDCNINADYFWYVDGVLVQTYSNVTPAAAPLDYIFTTTGNHTVRLLVDNKSCVTKDTTMSICIDPKIIPDFKINGADTVKGCVPSVVVSTSNLTNPSVCRTLQYLWHVYDAVTNAEYYPGSGYYTVANSMTDFAPVFTFIKTGKYNIQLEVKGTCGTELSPKRFVYLIDKAHVTLPADKRFCDKQTIDFSTTFKPTYNSNAGDETYLWTITGGAYSFVGGTSASSAFPKIQFSAYATYSISLTFTNQCSNETATRTIYIDQPATAAVTLPTVDTTVCYSTSAITVNGVSTGGALDSIRWTSSGSGLFDNKLSNNAIYSLSTLDKNTGSVTLTYTAYTKKPNGCPNVTDNVKISIRPRNTGQDSVRYICSGTSFTYVPNSTVPGSTFAWTSTVVYGTATGNTVSGTGTITNTLVNSSRTDSAVVVYTITPTSNGCTGEPFSLRVKVMPLPQIDSHRLKDTICSNTSAGITISSTATNVSYLWTSVVTQGAGVTGNTSITTATSNPNITDVLVNNGNVVAKVVYTIRIFGPSGCEGDTKKDSVYILPKVSQAVAGPDQLLCNQSLANLTANTPLIGVGKWTQYSGPAATIMNANLPNTTVTGLVGDNTYKFLYTIDDGTGCAPTIDSTIIVNRPDITTPDAGRDTTICDMTATANNILILRANAITRSFETATWKLVSQPAGSNGVFSSLADPNATFSFDKPGTYKLVWQISNDAGCTPKTDTVTIKVYVKPVAGAVILGQTNVCAGTDVTFTSPSYTGTILKWQYKTVPLNNNSWIDTLVTGPAITFRNVQDTFAVRTWVVSAGAADGCGTVDTSGPVVLNVAPQTQIGHITPDTSVCKNANTGIVSIKDHVGNIVRWEFSIDNGSNWIPINTNNTSITYNNLTQTTWYRAIVQSGVCPPLPSQVSIVTTRDGVTVANAGGDQALCNTTTASLLANVPALNETGLWSQVTGPNTALTSALNNNALNLAGLVPGIYTFKWTISNSVCPSTSATVNIVNYPPLTNTMNTDTIKICKGQSVSLSGDVPTGGNGVYVYQWQFSKDNIVWNDIIGATNPNLVFIPDTVVLIRRVVTAGSCQVFGPPVVVKVQTSIINNNISASQSICINTAPATIVGSAPTGGDGFYTYIWEQSTDGLVWTLINGATGKDYNPGVMASTMAYRRTVTTLLCAGQQASISAPVVITVNPDAIAQFTAVKTIACAPFNINSLNIQPTLYPDKNGTYNWIVNGTVIGTTPAFPGYTINKQFDSVTVQLLVHSKFGCKSDSMQLKFYTFPVPLPSFTVDNTEGCGPLTVNVKNTSQNKALFTYTWNFGNGQTSTAENPPAITFPPSPLYVDTIYHITLSASSDCDTAVFDVPVRVKSKPKALFSPGRATGCSPFTVTFTNNSLGNNVTYNWDFGDGTTQTTTSTGQVQHTFITAQPKTFTVQLVATNECGNDTLKYDLVVSPNTVKVDLAVNGSEVSGCGPHTVHFINNTSGGSSFRWDFGDGNILNTTKNIDTVTHTFIQPGDYKVVLLASNGCSDTTDFEMIHVFKTPRVDFSAVPYTVCIGDSIRFKNESDALTGTLWKFGDGSTTALTNPAHYYNAAGTYNVTLIGSIQYSTGNACMDSATKKVSVVATQPGDFSMSDTLGKCVPFKITFTNLTHPSALTVWDFGDGKKDTGDVVIHTFNSVGEFAVKMSATHPAGCSFGATKKVYIQAPSGDWSYDHGYICENTPVRYQVNAQNVDSLRWFFGDGTSITTTTNIVFHSYTRSGKYVPYVLLMAGEKCSVLLPGLDTIKVDYYAAGFRFAEQRACGTSTVSFIDTSRSAFGIAAWDWNFGDGSTGSGARPQHTYNSTNNWPVQLIIRTVGGCTDTTTLPVFVKVNDNPAVQINAESEVCAGLPVRYGSVVNAVDSIAFYSWRFSNNYTSDKSSVSNTFVTAGTYTAQLVISTIYGCFDTAKHTITVKPSPVVRTNPDMSLCKGQSTPLLATGANVYRWQPLNGLSCADCANPVANPSASQQYIVTGTNTYGCINRDTVFITVAQPINLELSRDATICVGQSVQLFANGGSNYVWSPATGLSGVYDPTPKATPQLTTKYRVIATDDYKCFADTGYVTITVGNYPTVNLGPDRVAASGTQIPLKAVTTNGPIQTWTWTPATDLTCANCPTPVATVKGSVCYTVTVTNQQNCPASDTMCVKAFCESTQVFIPNAFVPTANINNILMVRGQGIKMIKLFRIFNRWGQVVFEKANFPPNSKEFGWDGKINGVPAPPDVFVYTCEVVCENDVSYTYKGNVAILK